MENQFVSEARKQENTANLAGKPQANARIVFCLAMIVILLVVAMLDILLGAAVAYSGSFSEEAGYISAPSWMAASSSDSSYYSTLTADERETYGNLEKMYRSMSSACIVHESSNEKLNHISQAVLFDNPDIFWADNHYISFLLLPSLSYSVFIPCYNEPSLEQAKMKHESYMDEIRGCAEDISEAADPGSSGRLLAMAYGALDEVCSRLSYGENASDQTIKAFFGEEDGVAVCPCYSKCFALLCSAMGMECHLVCGTTVEGGAENHDWNMLKIGDQIYYADLTWSDTGHLSGHTRITANGYAFSQKHIPGKMFSETQMCQDGAARIAAERDGLRGKVGMPRWFQSLLKGAQS